MNDKKTPATKTCKPAKRQFTVTLTLDAGVKGKAVEEFLRSAIHAAEKPAGVCCEKLTVRAVPVAK